MPAIDLRSDFLSRPSAEMVRAMAQAAAEPAQFGLREDPRQRDLERRAAALLGHEDALLFPTCTMANQVALMLLAAPGELVLAAPQVHIVTSEAGAPAALGGITVQAVGDGRLDPPVAAWEAAARHASDELRPRLAALAIENTHNRGGGAVLSAADSAAIVALARTRGIAVHLDGARLFNAAVALGCAPADLAAGCDTVSVSLNKGLGAPVGAVLAASGARIARASVLRQRLGGGIRPTGMLAAAGLLALADWSHLAHDHRRARALAERIARIPGLTVDPTRVQTNIVIATIATGGPGPEALCERMTAAGVLAIPFGAAQVRFVLYRDIDDEAVERAAAIVSACL